MIAGSSVAFSYIDDQGQGGTPGRHKLVSLDLEGNERWIEVDFQLLGALDDHRLFGVTRTGALRALDAKGRKSDGLREGRKSVEVEELVDVDPVSSGFVIRTKREVLLVDRSLHIFDRFPVPGTRSCTSMAIASSDVFGEGMTRRSVASRSGWLTRRCAGGSGRPGYPRCTVS